jgi:hypothetical protein
LNLALARVEKPERLTFNKVRMRPSWLVNIDSRKFIFTDVAWENQKGKKSQLEEESNGLKKRLYFEPHNLQLLTVSFRNLAANAEEFNRFEEASNFRKSASECERLERIYRQRIWKKEFVSHFEKHVFCTSFFSESTKTLNESWRLVKNAPFDLVHFLYRRLSGFGENWFRAFLWIVAIWLVFAPLYYFVGSFGKDGTESISTKFSFAYSLLVMTFQRPEPRPFGFLTSFLYGLQTILAPLQAALLALAIRRKFLR